jgi:hypothetical protein
MQNLCLTIQTQIFHKKTIKMLDVSCKLAYFNGMKETEIIVKLQDYIDDCGIVELVSLYNFVFNEEITWEDIEWNK